jgi:transposase
MSAQELRRVAVFGRVKAQTLSLTQAATLLDLSYRQVKRLWRRFRRQGARGLQHRSAGRRSNRQIATPTRRRALALIRQKYSGTDDTRSCVPRSASRSSRRIRRKRKAASNAITGRIKTGW